MICWPPVGRGPPSAPGANFRRRHDDDAAHHASPRCWTNSAALSGSDPRRVAYYLDTSAAVKLVVEEQGSAALREWLAAATVPIVSSDLTRTELLRATRRGAPDQMEQARAVLATLVLVTLPPTTFERAAEVQPEQLRSLDAVHLAAALELGDELDAIVTYDDRMAAAARALGIAVVAPA